MNMLRGFVRPFFVILICCLVEVQMAVLSRNKTVKSSSIIYDWGPLKAIDGSTRRDADTCVCCYASSISSSSWIELDLGKSHRIRTINVIGRSRWDSKRQSFRNMQVMFIQVSEGFTGSPETTIAERVGNVTYVLPEPKHTRYISLVLRDEPKHFVVCELIVYGDCEDGEFGDYCENICHCDGDPCDKVTGICPSGKCLPGYFGDKCDTACQNITYGSSCIEQCAYCFNNGECNKTNGNCPGRCSAGYQGDICNQECTTHYYGQDCLSQCGFCINEQICNHVTGVCTNGCADGYLNQTCDLSCIPGNYGMNCQAKCGHCRQGSLCLHTNGTCTSGCVVGYQGDLCITECEDGFYGDGCQSKCGFCSIGTSCNKVSGECEQGCRPGYIGSYCNQSCLDGFYGDKCQSRCGNCKCGAVCNTINGACETGCKGFKRPLCVEECDNGIYNEGFVSQCVKCFNDTVRDKSNGKCTGSVAGFNGDNCDVAEASSGKDFSYCPKGELIGATIGAILLIEAFVGAVVYLIWKRRRGQADRRSAEEVSPYELPNRESFTSEHIYELE